MKKKTVLVETSKQGKQWSIKVTSTSAQLRDGIIGTIQIVAENSNLQILNATDPFGETKAKRKKKGDSIGRKVMQASETLLDDLKS